MVRERERDHNENVYERGKGKNSIDTKSARIQKLKK